MTPHELHLRRVAAFRDLASEELKAAQILSNSLRGQSAYFLQQCVEKLCRGILEIENVQVGPTHDISRLALMMSPNNAFVARFKALDELSPAATRYRYPGQKGDVRTISQSEVDRLLADVTRLHADVVLALNTYLHEKGNPA